ncbi:hypothetical protein A2U01_0039215, partial [Trifolium medium]|nr:hypothetical protein [Trifolium medium]
WCRGMAWSPGERKPKERTKSTPPNHSLISSHHSIDPGMGRRTSTGLVHFAWLGKRKLPKCKAYLAFTQLYDTSRNSTGWLFKALPQFVVGSKTPISESALLSYLSSALNSGFQGSVLR